MKSENTINPEFDQQHFFDQRRRRLAWRAKQKPILTDAQRRGFPDPAPAKDCGVDVSPMAVKS